MSCLITIWMMSVIQPDSKFRLKKLKWDMILSRQTSSTLTKTDIFTSRYQAIVKKS